MNYELKHVNPVAIFLNAIRIFVVVGFMVALLTFFLPNSTLRYGGFFQKMAATGMFTVVYALVVSGILMLVAWLYNTWAAVFPGVTIRLEQKPE
jgi:hypothetical protein